MNIGIIDIGWNELNINSIDNNALGGSETWLTQISKEFSKNHRVDVYCETAERCNADNLTYIPLKDTIVNFLELKNNGFKYDFIILNRLIIRYNINFIVLIKQYELTDNVFIQVHDLSIPNDRRDDHIYYDQEIHDFLINDNIVKGIITLNEWHKQNFILQYPSIQKDKIFCIPNGLDLDLFTYQNNNRDNRILWSSHKDRGLDILINYIYPIVKKEIPDFGIDVAGYGDLSDINTYDKDVKILGNLSKKDLYKEMSKHKAWFYPGTFPETFCLTMLEQIVNETIPVTPFTYGMKNVIGNDLVRKYWSDNIDFTSNFQKAVEISADKIINILSNNYTKQEELINKAKEYTWGNTVDNYINLYNQVNIKKYSHKGIFLSMACNDEFYKEGIEVVKQTWAKDLIEGKYPDYTWYAYMSCNKEHPNSGIDGNIIYVDMYDDIEYTYSKTISAYNILLQYGIDAEFIFRTNTSTYINVPKIITQIENCKETDLCGDMVTYNYTDGFSIELLTSCGIIIHESIMKKLLNSLLDETYLLDYYKADDTLISYFIKILNIKNNTILLHKDLPGALCPIYKPLKSEDLDDFKDHYLINNRLVLQDDNFKVNDYYYIRVRSVYDSINDRLEKGKEFEHMRELHEMFTKEKENL